LTTSCDSPGSRDVPVQEDMMPRRLDRVVSSVAAQLMDANASTATKASQQVLAHLVEQFGVDAAFLRHNDRNIRASKLVAEWPPRPNRPDPDPVAGDAMESLLSARRMPMPCLADSRP
jgi:diguanylate cyclase